MYARLHGGASPRGREGRWSVSGHFIGGYNEVNSGGDRKTPYSSALCRLATTIQRSRSIVNCRPRDYSFYHVQSPSLPRLCSLYILKLSDKRQFPTRTREIDNHSRQATNYHSLSIKLTPVDPPTYSAMCTSNLLASNLHVPFRTMASSEPTSLEFALSYGLTPRRAGERQEYYDQLICTFLLHHKSFYPTALGHIASLVRLNADPKYVGTISRSCS
jgi:hypothetical protein